MPIEPHRDDSRSDRARKVPAQGAGGHASARGAAAALPLRDRIQLTAEGGRWCLTVTRQYARHVHFSPDELAYVRELIGRAVSAAAGAGLEDREARP